MLEIAVATGNSHKVEEMAAILAPWGVRPRIARDFGPVPDVVEDGETFLANAVKKAEETARALGCSVIADDSGLVVPALGGAPGVYSARYAGEGGNDGRNVAKLLREMAGMTDRRARFVCMIAVADPEGIAGVVRGEVHGRIIHDPRGGGGFGYDPVFVPDGFEKTFAELPARVKNDLSHRARALRRVAAAGLLTDPDDRAAAGPGGTE
jgi:XTP/dITP diphosphohydrolase